MMEEYFEESLHDVKEYFETLDARVAELKHIGGGEEMIGL